MQLLLDSNKPVKAEITGRLFATVAARKLTVEDFDTLCLIVLSASIPALMTLKEFCDGLGGFCLSSDSLSSVGMTGKYPGEPLLLSLGVAFRDRDGLKISALGQKLYVLGHDSDFYEKFPD